jgi:AraC family transcriptional regulator, regulatory protein of adaptative response / methylated-DNA-[protein]-cysteine methyltransferase
MTEVAMRAGFGSLRRFNAAFAGVYRRPPTEIRAAKSASMR